MTKPHKPNIRRISFRKECFEALEEYLEERDMHQSHKEFLLDLAAFTDFLENENFIGAHYLGTVLSVKLKTLLPDWEKLARLHVPKNYHVPEIELSPE